MNKKPIVKKVIFEYRYGRDAVKRFKLLIKQGQSLSYIGREFNFTRAWASQLFQEFYGMTYREYKKKGLK